MTHTKVITGLKKLIDADSREQIIHKYIEQHPWLLSGTHSLDPNIVISKPPLGPDYFPDFAFFWNDSSGAFIELVEIEKPGLKVFTRMDVFTAEFNHAVQQVADWEDWCKRHKNGNEVLIEPLFDMGSGIPYFTRVRSRLIAGRRSSVLTNVKRRNRWGHRVHEVSGREIRTWDGFLESFPGAYYDSQDRWKQIKCVRYRKQKYEEITTRDI